MIEVARRRCPWFSSVSTGALLLVDICETRPMSHLSMKGKPVDSDRLHLHGQIGLRFERHSRRRSIPTNVMCRDLPASVTRELNNLFENILSKFDILFTSVFIENWLRSKFHKDNP